MNIFFSTMKYIFQAFLFLVGIYGVHSSWVYIRDSMTPRRTRHLYDSQVQKYKDILKELQEQQINDPIQIHNQNQNQTENHHDNERMQQDLEDFMRRDILTSL
jgi:predicted secreted protein